MAEVQCRGAGSQSQPEAPSEWCPAPPEPRPRPSLPVALAQGWHLEGLIGAAGTRHPLTGGAASCHPHHSQRPSVRDGGQVGVATAQLASLAVLRCWPRPLAPHPVAPNSTTRPSVTPDSLCVCQPGTPPLAPAWRSDGRGSSPWLWAGQAMAAARTPALGTPYRLAPPGHHFGLVTPLSPPWPPRGGLSLFLCESW